MDNRHSAISHGIELIQATGFKAGGHEQDVAARGYAVRHAGAEPYPTPALIVPRRLHAPAQEILIMWYQISKGCSSSSPQGVCPAERRHCCRQEKEKT